jgi:hypothetical protein
VAGNKLLPAYTNQALVAANPGMFTTAAAMGWPLASMIDEQKTNFSPRFGFAYRPWRGNKTVIRGGYGMFYAPVNDFAMERNMVGSPYQQSAYSVVNTLPSPTVTIQNPYAGVSGTNSLPTAYYWPVNLKNEYMQQFNLGMQHELLWGLIAEGNLEHQHTIRLDNGINFNQSQLGVSSGYPYPNLQTSTTGDVYNAWNRYDALELILRKTGRNYNFMLSNVWAKEISGAPMIYVGTLFPGPGNYLPDELKLNFVVDVPMGKGRTFLNHGGVVDAVLGGWETGSIFILHQGGDPLTIGTSVNYTLDNQRDTGRPNRVCSGRLSNPTPAQWFNQSCFVAPTAPSWGNAGTGILFGPGRSMIGDWSVYKNFSMPEEMKLQFRTEFFNVFNHPYWNDPGTTMPATGVFGVITAKSLNPRTVQFALRLSF